MLPESILIVEDRGIVATKICRDLERAGFTIAGAAPTLKLAMELADTLPLSGAVLDIDLRGEPVFPVATRLRARGVPFLFLSGYSRRGLPAEWQNVLLLEKPFDGAALARMLSDAIGGGSALPAGFHHTTQTIQQAWDRLRHTRDLVTEQRAWTEQAAFDAR